jgi:hypothetical protein
MYLDGYTSEVEEFLPQHETECYKKKEFGSGKGAMTETQSRIKKKKGDRNM